MEFWQYLKKQTQDTTKLYFNYYGISRKEYPKWPGWKIINEYKEDKTSIKDIKNVVLDLLVENFYRLKYIEEYRFDPENTDIELELSDLY